MSRERFKILIIIPNLGRGGAQQVFRDQLQFYSEKYDTLGCVFNWDDTFTDDRHSNIVSLNIPAGKNWLAKIFYFFKRVLALRKIKKQNNIDFSISHLEGADHVNILSKRKEKVICWIHGTKAFDENIEGALGTIRKKILIPLTYRLSDRIITVSEGIREELINHFNIIPTKITTIYNNFDLNDISNKATQNIPSDFEELFTSKVILITHCRLSRQKNLSPLIDIFISTKHQADVKLVILGDGELREELLQYCSTNGLSVYSIWETNPLLSLDYDVYFLGYERNPYPFLHRAMLYLMTSSWEGFPLSLCEAMACGIPAISSDCYTGPREIISPGLDVKQPVQQPVFTKYGILMPLANKDTVKSWADTIVALLKNGTLRNQLTINARERVSNFDRKKVSSQWLNLIEKS